VSFFQDVATLFAEIVEEDLESRGILLLRSEKEGLEPDRKVDRNLVEPLKLYQVTILDRWPEAAHLFPADEFLDRFLKRWVQGLVIKLARPGTLTTFPMRLPRGPEAACLGVADNFVMRAILDYSMFDDLKLIRVDVLAEWAL